jgi:molecular chaperone GrpE
MPHMQDDEKEINTEPEIATHTNTEEDVIEFEYNADGEEDLKATLKKLRKDLKQARTEKQEYLTNWQRERADFLNYKKEEAERSKNTVSYAQEKVILDLLPALDSYDMAFSNKEAWEKVDKNWRMGVEYIHQQILKALAEYGVSPIETKIGDAFDPNLHQPIDSVPTEEKEKENTISAIIQTGYKIADRVIRPSRVNVWTLN